MREEGDGIAGYRGRAGGAGEDAGFQLPGQVSIAHFLIERWVASHTDR